MNGDGALDVAVPIENGKNAVTVLLGDGTGRFAPAHGYPAGDGPVALASADFDVDGNVDFAVADENSNSVSILYGDGLGGFAAPIGLALPDKPQSIAAADWNGDARPDVAVRPARGRSTRASCSRPAPVRSSGPEQYVL